MGRFSLYLLHQKRASCKERPVFLVKQRGVQLCAGLCLRQAARDCTFWHSLGGDFAVSRQSVSDICAELYVLYFVKRASSET